jgi:hypothetical protein
MRQRNVGADGTQPVGNEKTSGAVRIRAKYGIYQKIKATGGA